LIIGITTFIFSVVGVKGGDFFGKTYRKSAEIIGGIILIIIGIN
jgi:putative Mn2+ efflux pump MntP